MAGMTCYAERRLDSAAAAGSASSDHVEPEVNQLLHPDDDLFACAADAVPVDALVADSLGGRSLQLP